MKDFRRIAACATGLSLLISTCACAASASTGPTSYRLSRMPVIYSVLDKIRTRYVNPSRIEPKRMLLAALDSIERRVPEILIQPMDRKHAHSIVVQVGAQSKRFDVSGIRAPWELTKIFRELFRFIGPRLHKDTDPKQVEFAAVDGILSTLDPHTILMRPEFFQELEIDTSGHFGGLGIEISVCDGRLTIRRPLPGTPAWKTRMKYGQGIFRTAPTSQAAKLVFHKGRWIPKTMKPTDPRLSVRRGDELVRLRAGDRIVRIQEESTVNMTLSESVKRLRGKPGTDVLIWITRKGWRKPRPFLIQRAEVHVRSVTYQDLGNHVGYVKISKFSATTGAELRKVLVTHAKLNGLIMDLRDNHGGLLDQAAAVMDLFVQSGTLLAAKESGRIKPIRARRATTAAPKLPLVVLTNEETASAAEIVAAGLKQLNRALTLGRRTFGKGSVQMIFRTPFHTALKLTISQWLAPGNLSIQGRGLVPDVAAVPVRIEKGKPIEYLSQPAGFRKEKDLKRPLGVPTAELKSKPLAVIHYLRRPVPPRARSIPCRYCGQPKGMDRPRNPSIFYKDFPVFLAERLLREAGRQRRLAMLAAGKGVLSSVAKNEDMSITKRLETLGVDWTRAPGKRRRPPVVTAHFTTKRLRVKAGSKLTIKAVVTNQSSEPAYRVRGLLDSTNPFIKGRELLFGKVPPSASRKAEVTLRIPSALGTQKDPITVRLFTDETHPAGSAQGTVTVEGQSRPNFSFSYGVIEKAGADEDGLFEVGETLLVHMTVSNRGKGSPQEAYAVLQNQSGSAIDVASGRFRISDLKPNRSKKVSFRLKIQKVPRSGVVRLRLRVYDCVSGVSLSKKIALHVWPSGTDIAHVRGTAALERNATKIRLCPDQRCTPLAVASAGTTLTLSGKIGKWYMVRLKGSQTGFVPGNAVRILKGHPLRRGVIRSATKIVPPKIVMKPVPLEASSRWVAIRGFVTHPSKVADMFVRVSNPNKKIYERKAAYLSNRNGRDRRRMGFNVRVPLWPGKNIIEVIARHDDEIQTTVRRVTLVAPMHSTHHQAPQQH